MFEALGGVVRFHRKKSGLTQLELANLAGIGKAAVYDLEHTTKSTRIDTLQKVLKVLNISIKLESPIMSIYKDEYNEEGDSFRRK